MLNSEKLLQPPSLEEINIIDPVKVCNLEYGAYEIIDLPPSTLLDSTAKPFSLNLYKENGTYTVKVCFGRTEVGNCPVILELDPVTGKNQFKVIIQKNYETPEEMISNPLLEESTV